MTDVNSASDGRVGIVVVSHSATLASAAVELSLAMVPENPARIVLAAGTADGGIGTDAIMVADAIGQADEGRGVLVFMDLGSAVLSAEMALEFSDAAGPVRLTSAPFVEGLLAGVVAATAGLDLDTVEREALGALAPKQGHLSEPADVVPAPVVPAPTAGPSRELTVRNRDGVHARPAARIVALLAKFDATLAVENVTRGGASATVSGTTALLTLGARQGDVVRVTASGADAEALLEAVAADFEAGFGESLEQAPVVAARSVPRGQPIGVSAGVAVGPVYRLARALGAPTATGLLAATERADAAAEIAHAAETVAQEFQRRAGVAAGDAREILAASALLVADPGLIEGAQRRVLDGGSSAAVAVWDEFGLHADALRDQGGRNAERAADIDDARMRLVAALTGQEVPELPVGDAPFVLVAHDLAPADTALLDPATCLALVTEEGGPTSHTAIIARSLGIPAVVAAAGAWSQPQGTTLLVNGTTGELVWDPSAELVTAAESQSAPAAFDGHGATADGVEIPLRANVGSAADATGAASLNAEGVGLFRTEFCFLDREQAPTVDEQVDAYRQVFAAFPGQRVVVRTLDAGSDKPLAFVTVSGEENPALGVRGYRTATVHPELLDQQLLAIARAAAAESADVAVMAPMIATIDEAAAFADAACAHGLTRVGVMVETPAAALLADRLLSVVDFVSIGTNDLTQYTMAADRQVGGLASLNDPWQPAVLDLVARVGAAGAATGKSVGVCGEAAADPLLAAVLVGAGVTSLSMTARSIARVAESLRSVSLAQCQAAAAAVLTASSPTEARTLAHHALST